MKPKRYIDGLQLLKELKEWIMCINDTHYCPVVEEETLEGVIDIVERLMGIFAIPPSLESEKLEKEK